MIAALQTETGDRRGVKAGEVLREQRDGSEAIMRSDVQNEVPKLLRMNAE